ncbi:MAG: rod shape-determining protein MreC, partial [bacterium]
FRPVENFFIWATSPVQRLMYVTSYETKNFISDWVTKRDLLKENGDLQEQLKRYQLDTTKLNGLSEENALLKKELNFVQTNKIKFVSAKIITGVSDNISKSVVINRGTNDGVVKGLAVVVDDGVLIGKIYDVYPDYSKVLLLTDNKSKVAVTVQNLTQTVGLAEGQFGLSFSMTNVPQDQDVREGDLVVTSGLEGNIPKNLLVAVIDGISQVESEIFKTATLKPIVSFDNLSYVTVIIP